MKAWHIVNNVSLSLPQIVFVYWTLGCYGVVKLLHGYVSAQSMWASEQRTVFCDSTFTNGKGLVAIIIPIQKYSQVVCTEINCQRSWNAIIFKLFLAEKKWVLSGNKMH